MGFIHTDRQVYSELELEQFAIAIEEVIARGALRAVYQPLVDLRTYEVFAYEALARDGTGYFTSPKLMFDAAVAGGRPPRETIRLRGSSI